MSDQGNQLLTVKEAAQQRGGRQEVDWSAAPAVCEGGPLTRLRMKGVKVIVSGIASRRQI